MNSVRQHGRRRAGLGGSVLLLAGITVWAGVLQGREPTEHEQYFLELLNRARSDPGAEVARLSGEPWGAPPGSAAPDLNEGVLSIPIADQPYQPLAFNTDLMDAASDYSSILIASGQTGHFVGGTDPMTRMNNAGYSFLPTPGGGAETLGRSSSTTFNLDQATIDDHWQQMFINGAVFGRTDRIQLMREEYREVGVGTVIDDAGPGGTPYDISTVVNLGYNTSDPFLTGVFYDDIDSDNFYTPGNGEALGAISVDVYIATTSLLETSFMSFASGGYSVQLAAGTYDLVIHDPVAGAQSIDGIVLGSENVKVDYLRSLAVPEPSTALLMVSASALLLRRRRAR